jgi:hypothetical protein
LSVGNWWEYESYKHSSIYDGDVKLQIVSHQKQGNIDEYKCFMEKDGAIIDSAIFYKEGNKLTFAGLGLKYSFMGNFILECPFDTGYVWPGFTTYDTVRVKEIVDTIASGYHYNNDYIPFYMLKRYYFVDWTDTVEFRQTLELTKDIGMSYQNYTLRTNEKEIYRYRFELKDLLLLSSN